MWAIAGAITSGRSGGGEAQRNPAEKVLRERFAGGVIDAEEYGRALQTLRGDAPERDRRLE